MKNNFRGYIFSRAFMEERVPQHIQNIIIRDYCNKNNLNYLLSAAEYRMKNCHLMLEEILNDMKNIRGIVAYSLFQMPENNEKRKKIFETMIKLKKEIHFAVENLKITKKNEVEKIENIWLIKKSLPFCLKKLN
tara:strand:+ start:210 stop:611 length:402 start_codon:yes stop_codon:yes gene_type:complete